MARIRQGAVERGSQHWLQQLVTHSPGLLASEVLPRLQPPCEGAIEWLSPLANDDFAEYRDAEFLDRLGIVLSRRPLPSFWPARGPVWDGLARTARGDVLLIEAKANIPELSSPATKAGPASAKQIHASLSEAMPSFGARSSAQWHLSYYQYANRLAHLHLLRGLNDVPAYLVFLYFTNAHEVSGPCSPEAWAPEIQRAHETLGLGSGLLSPFVLDVFIDTNQIEASP